MRIQEQIDVPIPYISAIFLYLVDAKEMIVVILS